MEKPKMLVTAAAGRTGMQVVAQLLKAEVPVRAIVRHRDARADRLAALGAEVVAADLYDAEQMERALHGVKRAYFCAPWEPQMLQAAVVFAHAAHVHRLDTIVGMTQWLASPSHPSVATRQAWLIDRIFAALPDVAHVAVNPGYFADNYLRLTRFAAHFGVLPNLTGDSRNAPPSNEDIARVVVGALLDPEKHAGKAYRPTGPKLLSVPEMAEILGRVLGRTVRAVPMPWFMFVKAARAEGVNRFLLAQLKHYVEEHRRGTFEAGAPNDHVWKVTGTPAEDFETTAARYAAHPEARRTFANRARAIGEFVKIGFTPGFSVGRFERASGTVAPQEATLAIDSARWRREHDIASTSRTQPAAATGGWLPAV